MSDHPCVSRRLRKEKGTFVISWFVTWKEKNMGPSEKHVRGQEEESEFRSNLALWMIEFH